MNIFVVMSTNAKKPDRGDEVEGFYPVQTMAEDFCKAKNDDYDTSGRIFYFEPASLLKPVG